MRFPFYFSYAGLASVHTKSSISLDSNSLQNGNTTNEMYILSAPTRSSSSLSAEVSSSLFELDSVEPNKNIRSKMPKDTQMNYRDTNRAADRNNNNNSKKFKITSSKRQPNQIVSLRPASEGSGSDTSSIIINNNNLHHNNNHKNNKNKNNKNDDNVISSESQKETIVSNAYAAELKGVPPLSIHEHDILHTNGTGDGQFNHNTLDEYYKEPMYFGTENSTTITTQIGANAHLPCTIHHIGESVVSIKIILFFFIFIVMVVVIALNRFVSNRFASLYLKSNLYGNECKNDIRYRLTLDVARLLRCITHTLTNTEGEEEDNLKYE